jgi:DNA-binding MarR family transcriptional regulator
LAVKRLQWHHHRESNTRLAELGLTLPQWDVLRHLHANPNASLHALAVLASQTDQSMGTLAARMVDRGLLKRVEGPGRAVRHHITPEGGRLRVAGSKIVDGVLTESVGRLDADERAALHGLLTKALG